LEDAEPEQAHFFSENKSCFTAVSCIKICQKLKGACKLNATRGIAGG
jgi:hypothetical protein